MKKHWTALFIAAAVAPGVVCADDDVRVYGIAQVEVASTDPQGDGDTAVSVVDNAQGRVGVVATEDLGSGLKGLAKFEFKVDTADGNASEACSNDDCSSKTGISLTGRELLVGLKGGFGQMELGQLKSAYKYSGGVKYDPFVATLLEARGKGGMSSGVFGHNGFINKSIGYSSPKLGAVDLRATYGPSENDSSYTVSLKAGFKAGEVFVAALDQGDRQGDDQYSAWKLGGQLRLAGGAHKISLQYEATEDKTITTTTKPTYIFLGYQGTFGHNIFVAQFGSNDADADNKDKTYYALGAIHRFSKNTRVFGGYRVTDADDDSGQSVISMGVRKDFKQ